jgi:hypothetical protein
MVRPPFRLSAKGQQGFLDLIMPQGRFFVTQSIFAQGFFLIIPSK